MPRKTDGVRHDVPAHLKRWYVRDVQNGSAHKDYTLWGSDKDRYHQYVVTTDFIKAEDYNEMRAKWDELKGTGTYESWVKEYLAGKGYTLKTASPCRMRAIR